MIVTVGGDRSSLGFVTHNKEKKRDHRDAFIINKTSPRPKSKERNKFLSSPTSLKHSKELVQKKHKKHKHKRTEEMTREEKDKEQKRRMKKRLKKMMLLEQLAREEKERREKEERAEIARLYWSRVEVDKDLVPVRDVNAVYI
jgi:hypothetical protein